MDYRSRAHMTIFCSAYLLFHVDRGANMLLLSVNDFIIKIYDIDNWLTAGISNSYVIDTMKIIFCASNYTFRTRKINLLGSCDCAGWKMIMIIWYGVRFVRAEN